MGKPYEAELRCLDRTYSWACQVPIDTLRDFVRESCGDPLVIVGSGGSLTAARFAARLHQEAGSFAKAVTPLDLASCPVRHCSVLLLTARGRNADIHSAFRLAANLEPRRLVAVCLQVGSPLARFARSFRFAGLQELCLPSGKDGFLATNSLIAFVTILCRAYGGRLSGQDSIPAALPSPKELLDWAQSSTAPLLSRDTWVTLYAGWGEPAALDCESKFTEAALGHVQAADYRNFAHGRHHWVAKRGEETALVALTTPDEKEVAERTLCLLPKGLPRLRIHTERRGAGGGLELLVKMLYVIGAVGHGRGIDPGRPCVPEFGRRLYHVSPRSSQPTEPTWPLVSAHEAAAIARKNDVTGLGALTKDEVRSWRRAYRDYVRRLRRARFGAVVLDYDGTLCDPKERFAGSSKELRERLSGLLREGLLIGIGTGRGKSARESLARMIPAKYWEQVVIGYYSGSDIGGLGSGSHPDKERPGHPALSRLVDLLQGHPGLSGVVQFDCRPDQVAICLVDAGARGKVAAIVQDVLARVGEAGVRCLESSHSLDLLAPGVTKRTLVLACEEAAGKLGRPKAALCIGDRGRWPGNDYDLLTGPHSLSVDTVSPDPQSCWNLAAPGHRGVQATLEYLTRLKVEAGVARYR